MKKFFYLYPLEKCKKIFPNCDFATGDKWDDEKNEWSSGIAGNWNPAMALFLGYAYEIHEETYMFSNPAYRFNDFPLSIDFTWDIRLGIVLDIDPSFKETRWFLEKEEWSAEIYNKLWTNLPRYRITGRRTDKAVGSIMNMPNTIIPVRRKPLLQTLFSKR